MGTINVKDEMEKYFETCEKLLEEGVDLSSITYKRREELHERR